MTWTATPSAGWLAVDPPGGAISGGASAPLVVRADRAALPSTAARAAVHIRWDGETIVVWVTIRRDQRPEATAEPSPSMRDGPTRDSATRDGEADVTRRPGQSG